MRYRQILAVCLSALALAACGSSKSDSADAQWAQTGVSASAPRTLGVNAYLWQASLDTLSFLPLATVDPYGGVILSDWYMPSPGERLKITVHISDRALRPSGLKVQLFREVRNGADWQFDKPNPDIARKLEDAILTRARALRLADQRVR